MKHSAILLLLIGFLVLAIAAGCQNSSQYQPDNQITKNQENADHAKVRYPEYRPDAPWHTSD